MSEPPNIARSTDEHAVERPVPKYSARARRRDDDADAVSPLSPLPDRHHGPGRRRGGGHRGRRRGRDRRQQLAGDLAPGLVELVATRFGHARCDRDRGPRRAVLPAVGRRSARRRHGRQSRKRGSRLGAGTSGGERDQRAAFERTPGRRAPEPAVERRFAAERQHDRLQPLRARRQGLRDLRRDAVDRTGCCCCAARRSSSPSTRSST